MKENGFIKVFKIAKYRSKNSFNYQNKWSNCEEWSS